MQDAKVDFKPVNVIVFREILSENDFNILKAQPAFFTLATDLGISIASNPEELLATVKEQSRESLMSSTKFEDLQFDDVETFQNATIEENFNTPKTKSTLEALALELKIEFPTRPSADILQEIKEKSNEELNSFKSFSNCMLSFKEAYKYARIIAFQRADIDAKEWSTDSISFLKNLAAKLEVQGVQK